jgi:hypothetical protein
MPPAGIISSCATSAQVQQLQLRNFCAPKHAHPLINPFWALARAVQWLGCNQTERLKRPRFGTENGLAEARRCLNKQITQQIIMKILNRTLVMAGVASLLCLGTFNLDAQERRGGEGRGNFDPEQMRERMMEQLRERLEVKGEDEWKLIQSRINAVNEARRELGGGMGGMAFGRGGGPGGPGGRGGGGPGGFRGEPNPEVEALQKAIEGGASANELKTRLAKVREARKEREAKLEKAQENLREVLTVRQEANAVLMGLLR